MRQVRERHPGEIVVLFAQPEFTPGCAGLQAQPHDVICGHLEGGRSCQPGDLKFQPRLLARFPHQGEAECLARMGFASRPVALPGATVAGVSVSDGQTATLGIENDRLRCQSVWRSPSMDAGGCCGRILRRNRNLSSRLFAGCGGSLFGCHACGWQTGGSADPVSRESRVVSLTLVA